MCVSWLEGKMDGKEIYAIRVLGRITINFNIRPIHALKAHVQAAFPHTKVVMEL